MLSNHTPMNSKQIANLLIVACVVALIRMLWPKAPPPAPAPRASPIVRAAQTENQSVDNSPPPQAALNTAAADAAAAQVAAEMALKFAQAQAFVSGPLKLALNRYKIDMGEYPSTAEGIQALITPPARAPNANQWRGPYADATVVPVDPWGHAYNYAYPSVHAPEGVNTFDAWSGGPAGDNSTNIGNW